MILEALEILGVSTSVLDALGGCRNLYDAHGGSRRHQESRESFGGM